MAIPLATPPQKTTAGAATPLTFETVINRLEVQNKSALPLYIDWTGGTAGPGSWLVASNGGQFSKEVELLVFSVYTANATTVNGNDPFNIVVIAE